MNDNIGARALWHVAPGRAEIIPARVRAAPGEVLVRALWSGISRGTERLVSEGRVPQAEWRRMRAPFQEGDFPFPVKYGYAAVGVVEAGPSDLHGRCVFALYPHQTRFALPVHAVLPLPTQLPPRRAVLAANMETALNAVWDSGAAPGDRIAVVGGGALGLLTASILSRIVGTDVTLIDKDDERREICAQINVKFETPDSAPRNCDLAFHASASAAGLRVALETLGQEGAVIEMSWHGEGETPVALGGAFHAQRLRIVSSQVGAIPAARRARWDFRRRLAMALDLLCDNRLDALITAEEAFDDLPARLPAIIGPDARGVATVVRYDAAHLDRNGASA